MGIPSHFVFNYSKHYIAQIGAISKCLILRRGTEPSSKQLSKRGKLRKLSRKFIVGRIEPSNVIINCSVQKRGV